MKNSEIYVMQSGKSQPMFWETHLLCSIIFQTQNLFKRSKSVDLTFNIIFSLYQSILPQFDQYLAIYTPSITILTLSKLVSSTERTTVYPISLIPHTFNVWLRYFFSPTENNVAICKQITIPTLYQTDSKLVNLPNVYRKIHL
jgi:hypothetical protein